ncbi:MAG: DNA-directed RNA polymerase subunit delta [Aerococcus sp.]|nr:DNA-directed RNA polymerase subunit delta [Aerococcus sp.]
MNLQRLDHQNKSELSMIEVAHEILAETNQVHDFTKLLEEIQDYLGMSDQQLEERMADFYTELNSDGSFISLGENRWGLRSWYAVDSINEAIVGTLDDDDLKSKHKARRRKTNVFADGEDEMIDYNADDPEDYDEYEDEEDLDEDDYEDEENEDLDNDRDDNDHDSDDEDEDELRSYKQDLEELGDSDDDDLPEDGLEDGLEGDLAVINDDDDDYGIDTDDDEDEDE